MKKCPNCKKELVKIEDIILDISGYIFVVKGERCIKCNEEFPYEEETQKVIDISRKLGVWPEPLKLYRQLSKSGRGLILRVPSDIERQLKLTDKEEVSIEKIGNKIVISSLENESFKKHTI